ncbi:MAG: NAD(P)-binding protein [Mesorhizobium sp.]|nr:NAD(P)-binding protein [Mesorhizobium sp.]
MLGSGMAALSAIFRVTSNPQWRDRFEVDVYQQGWRAGGKCASSRDTAQGLRNYEHGLHVLGGFYHNTFRILRECYDEWPSTGKSTIPLDRAFSRHGDFYLMQDGIFGWDKKHLSFPVAPGEPGVRPTEISPLGMIERIRQWITRRLRDSLPADVLVPPTNGRSLGGTLSRLEGLMAEFSLGRSDESCQVIAAEYRSLGDLALGWLIGKPNAIDYWDLLILTELVGRIGTGFFRDEIYLHGFDAIDHWDAIEWLDDLGASEFLKRSTFVTSGYDYAFAFVDGNPKRRNFAAGVALRGMLRLVLTYHGSPFVHMNGGMGEIVIKPIYEVLVQRGVRFHFFHRVQAIRMQPGDHGVRSIDLSVQAELKEGAETYEPLVENAAQRYWPTEPLWDQLAAKPVNADFESWWYVGADERRLTLTAGDDFDVVLSGIPIAALDPICADFHQALPGWSDFVSMQRTTPTIAVQYWLAVKTNKLGNDDNLPLVTGCVMPASTWCDMSFLLNDEQPINGKVSEHLSYACGPFPRNPNQPDVPDDHFAGEENRRAAAAEKVWNQYLRQELLPDLPADSKGDFPAALEPTVHVRANVSPSELYALSVSNSIASRPRVDGLGLDNFFVCGDWTRTGTNVGAVESAVTSGLQAARAIAGAPQYIYGETDFP